MAKKISEKEVQDKPCTLTKKKTVYVCSNGAEYNTREDAQEYQQVLDASKEVKEKEI